MQVTFILRNLTEETLSNISNMPASDAYNKLMKWAYGDLRHLVSVKYGVSDAFRDRVEVNSLMKAGCYISFAVAPRRGYKLATFILERKTNA